MPEIAKAYQPSSVESYWYPRWIEAGCFAGRVDASKDPYCIVIPPPNVTGVLTMGHVLNNTIQDVLIRRARQQGKAALWLPGTDHAGLATQTRVERELRSEGLHRRDLGRENFLKRAVEWRDKHGGIIIEQLKHLGASCDWARTVHTLDDGYSRGVLEAFVRLYKKGLIYRGKRMVNWCPASQTALSDEEVIMKPSKGFFYRMRYELVEEPGKFLEISTTRPETIPGDTAVAVHPDDERYRHLIGKKVWRPFPRAQIPIIGDKALDRGFGTGVLKVTPAHDPVDFAIGQRHGLEILDVMHPDGTMNALAGPELEGLDRFKAREKAVEMLKGLGALLKEEPYENNVGYSERAGVPVEPRLSEQWFLRYPKVAEAKRAVTEGIIKFHPEHWTKTYTHWLDNLQDWCISRQVWWGHRIPVWYPKGDDRSDPSKWHISLTGPADPENWEQDEDTLDTWASSWLWPFATFGWPEMDAQQKSELDFWYPTSALVTGPDIIFFWVARMIIAGLEFMGQDKENLTDEEIRARSPFRDVYFTGIIRDAQGRKMSKSLGNSPDPLDIIEKFGADGLRFGILSCAPQGQDILFSDDRVQQGRNFGNKLWNAARFRQMSGDSADNSSLQAIVARIDVGQLDSDDKAILGRLAATTDAVNRDLDGYEFNTATQDLFAFFWTDFCDWYVETAKARLQDPAAKATVLAVQDLCLRQVCLLLHPYMPFITEQLWHDMGFGGEGTFIQNVPPGTGAALLEALAAKGVRPTEADVALMRDVRECVTQARALKAQRNLAARRDSHFWMTPASPYAAELFASQQEKLKRLIGAERIDILETGAAAPAGSPAAVCALGTVYLDLAGTVDVSAERARLEKEITRLDGILKGLNAKLSSPAFTEKAPANVVAGARAQLAENEAKREEYVRLLVSL